MKSTTILSFLFLLSTALSAQIDCNKFLEQGKTAAKRENFELAMNSFNSARRCGDKQMGELVDKEVTKLFNAINKKKEQAEKEKQRAETQTKIALVARHEADSTAEANRRAALTAYANDLAYKSKTALRDGDRNTAFRLADLAHCYVDADNPMVIQALIDALYHIDNPAPTCQPLPRVANLEGPTFSGSIWAFSLDGKRLATGSWDTLKIWDLGSRKSLMTLVGHSFNLKSVVFSPDGKRLATVQHWDSIAKIWDLESDECLMTLVGHSSGVENIAFSPDGKRLATGSRDNTAKIWDLESEECLMTLVGTVQVWKALHFHPMGKGWPRGLGTIQQKSGIWNARSV